MNIREEFGGMSKRQKAAIAGLTLVSAATWGTVAYSLMNLQALPTALRAAFTSPEPSYRPVQETVRVPESADALMARIMEKSQGGLAVVMVGPPGCAPCAEMSDVLARARYEMRDMPFSTFIIDPAANPDIAARVGHGPKDPPRFYNFFNGEKIHVSHGISDQANHISSYLEGVFNLAYGGVSHLDRYQPAPNP